MYAMEYADKGKGVSLFDDSIASYMLITEPFQRNHANTQLTSPLLRRHESRLTKVLKQVDAALSHCTIIFNTHSFSVTVI